MDNLIEGKSYRLVVQRSPLKDKEGKQQIDIFGVIYTYRCILTNNWTSTEKDIITFYNERGASEKNFDIQNNDFGWSHLPFSFMAENMVFMMVTAMLKNFYLYLVRHISEKVKPLKSKQTESLYPAFCQRAGKMGANRKTEHSEPIYK